MSQEESVAIEFRHATLLKRRLRYRCFPMNFEKFLRTPFLQSTCGRLLFELVLQ